MQILSQRKVVEVVTFALWFEDRQHPGSGLSFACDQRGVVDESRLHRAGLENLVRARGEDAHLYREPVVSRQVNRWVEPRIGLCSCGCKVELDRFTNTCSCGRDYNSAGQELAPREQWGEETGESADEILRVDGMSQREIWGE